MTEFNPPTTSGFLDYRVPSTDLIKAGFQLFAKAPGVFIAYLIIGWVLSIVFGYIPIIGPLASFLIGILHSAGFYVLFHNLHEKGTVKIEECFEAVDFFGQATLANIIYIAMIFLGFLLLVIPGIYLMVAYTLATPYILFDRMKAWDALERSRKVITLNFLGVSWFCTLCMIMNILGILALGIGVLITAPVTVGAIYLLYRHIKQHTAAPAPNTTPIY